MLACEPQVFAHFVSQSSGHALMQRWPHASRLEHLAVHFNEASSADCWQNRVNEWFESRTQRICSENGQGINWCRLSLH